MNEKKICLPPKKSLKKVFRSFGPGIIAGSADDDAGGIATYSITGASTGYSLLWLLLISTPLLIVVQDQCARIGAVTKQGLNKVIRENYGMPAAVVSAVLVGISGFGTLCAEIAGVTSAIELFTHIHSYYFVLPVTLIVWFIAVYRKYKVIEKYLMILTLSLLTYILSGFLGKPNWLDVIRGTFIPHVSFDKQTLIIAVGLLGTTITPYLFFWQAEAEIEKKLSAKNLVEIRVDTYIGMIYCNLIAFFIILATGSQLFTHGKTIKTAADAAIALIPFSGKFSGYIFAAGLFGASLLSMPVLASSVSYVISETAGWRAGLDYGTKRAKGFYLAFSLAMVFAAIINLLGISPIDIMFYSQVLLGIAAPYLLFMIMLITRNKKIMKGYTNSLSFNIIGWSSVVIMTIFVITMFWSILKG